MFGDLTFEPYVVNSIGVVLHSLMRPRSPQSRTPTWAIYYTQNKQMWQREPDSCYSLVTSISMCLILSCMLLIVPIPSQILVAEHRHIIQASQEIQSSKPGDRVMAHALLTDRKSCKNIWVSSFYNARVPVTPTQLLWCFFSILQQLVSRMHISCE